MNIVMKDQFEKLNRIVSNCKYFYFYDGEGEKAIQYKGPVNPTSIINIEWRDLRTGKLIGEPYTYFVISESVPGSYTPNKKTDGVGISLNEKFEFKDYNKNANIIKQLGLILGDTDPFPRPTNFDGTIQKAKEYWSSQEGWSFSILFKT